VSVIEESTEFGARAARHLREDRIVWLTTVTPAGAPVPSPVWFQWDGADSVLMHSRAGTARERNLRANPRVSLNFDGDGSGGDIVVLSGRAELGAEIPADADEAYYERYAWGLERLGTTREEFTESYPVPIRIELTRLRGQ
jgi:PPOX class probable F420-dependent enzyme